MKRLRRDKSTKGAQDLLNPKAGTFDFYSLMLDYFHRAIEQNGSITLDVTNMISPHAEPRQRGQIRWEYGAWAGNTKFRNPDAPIPFDEISKLEVTFWFEPDAQPQQEGRGE